MMTRPLQATNERGAVLVHVLGIVAIASAIVLRLFSLQDASAGLRQRHTDIAQARVLALGAESSIVSGFRQDYGGSPGIDHYSEAWAARAQAPIRTPLAMLSVAVTDAQARYDLNRLGKTALSDVVLAGRIVEAAGLGPDVTARLVLAIQTGGPIVALSDLGERGFSAGELEALAPFCTGLSGQQTINLNTADAELVRIVFDNPANAGRFLALRERQGYVTAEDLGRLALIAPLGTGLQTDAVIVAINVRSGRSDVRMVSQLSRTVAQGEASVAVVRREFGGN